MLPALMREHRTNRKSVKSAVTDRMLSLLRFTFVLFMLTCVQVSAKGKAQNVHVVLKNAPMEKVITTLNRQSGYSFFYNKALLGLSRPVTIDLPSGTLAEALAICFKQQPLLAYSVVDKVVVIKKKQNANNAHPERIKNVVTESSIVAQQPGIIHGRVTDSTGAPIHGAAVIAVRSKAGTLTDDNGDFQLPVDPGESIRISYVGFETKTVTAGSGSDPDQLLRIVLHSVSSSLDDLIVVGYGTQKKVNLTGAVTSVTMDDVLEDRPVTSTSQALQGAVPGLQITSGSGQPGTSSGINIRGFTSINGGSPLVLVDNVPMDMDEINPKDIESVSVLKDAATSAIYGARAAFGVILITTKKGALNQPIRFNYSTNIALTHASSLPRKVTPYQFVSALKDFGTTSYWSGQEIGTWLDLLEQYNNDPGMFPEGSTTVDGAQYPLAQTDIYGKLFNPHCAL